MKHLTTTPARTLAKGQKLAGVMRDPLILAIVCHTPGLCRNEIADEYERATGEWVGPTSLYANLRRLNAQGLIRKVPRRHLGVLRDDVDELHHHTICWEPTTRGRRLIDQLTGIFGAVRKQLRLSA